jgi:hypothetical protein
VTVVASCGVRAPFALLLLLLLLAGLGACREKPEFHKVEFPGFSLEVPTNLTYGTDLVVEYRAAQRQAIVGGRVVLVGWQPGPRATVAEMPALVQAISAALPGSDMLESEPATEIAVGDRTATRLVARNDKMTLTFIDIECGKRSVILCLGGSGDVDELLDRMVGSFDCHPIPAQDDAIGTTAAPFGVDDPKVLAGWHAIDNDGTFTIANGELNVIALQIGHVGDEAAKALPKILPPLFEAIGARWTVERSDTRRGRVYEHGKVIANGEAPADGIVTLWNCPGRDDGVVGLALAPAGTDMTLAIELLGNLRCARPDDPPLPLAPAPE